MQGGRPLKCTGAPIRGREGTISRVLVAMRDYRLVRPALLSAVTQRALEAEEDFKTRNWRWCELVIAENGVWDCAVQRIIPILGRGIEGKLRHGYGDRFRLR